MQIDIQRKELTVKLVYYGPGLSGKTTNLQALHRFLRPERRSRLMALETKDDRTLFFDMLPLTFQTAGGLHVRLKLFTVPGQVMHNSTRRLVLQGADGVAFIADSQLSEARANQASFVDLRDNLQQNGLDTAHMPLVIQFNKRDLSSIRSDEEISAMQERSREPIYRAVAIRGGGVLETFFGLVERTWAAMEDRHALRRRFGLERSHVVGELQQCFEAAEARKDAR